MLPPIELGELTRIRKTDLTRKPRETMIQALRESAVVVQNHGHDTWVVLDYEVFEALLSHAQPESQQSPA